MLEMRHSSMTNRDGKRKLGPAEEGQLSHKRHKVDNPKEAPCTSKDVPKVDAKKKRPRTSGLRKHVKTEIERALKSSPSPVAHLFFNRDDDGDPYAKFKDVVMCIPTLHSAKVLSLNPNALLTINNITTIFRIYQMSNELRLSYRPIECDIKRRTVYIDNLPLDCNATKLARLLTLFGVVVEIKMPLTPSKKITMKHGVVEIGRRPKRFAFVQFTEEEAAMKIAEHFAHNMPCTSPSEKLKKQSGHYVPTQLRWIQNLKRLKRKGRRRKYWETEYMFRICTALRLIRQKEKEARWKLKKMRRRKLLKQRRRSSASVSIANNSTSSSRQTNSLNASDCNNSTSWPPTVEKKKHRSAVVDSHNGETMIVVDVKEKRQRYRKRKKKSHPAFIKGSVNDYFRESQVIPFDRYGELRSKYLELKKNSLSYYLNTLRELGLSTKKRDIASSSLEARDMQWTVQTY